MYDLPGYARMVGNAARTEPYVAALHEVVRPGDVVLDIGTGTGLFALIACQLGAARVYAVEQNPLTGLARRIARANGFDDRIVFIQGDSTRIDLPERANVLVSDLRGALPLFGTHLPTIIDARTRLLTAAASLIPRCDSLWIAAVDAEAEYARLIDVWKEDLFGLDMRAALAPATQSQMSISPAREHLCSTSGCWTTIDYATVRDPGASGTVVLDVAQARTAHGLGMWFDSSLGPSTGFSGAPGQPRLVYGHTFLPWSERVSLRAGDRIAVTLRAILAAGDYLWSWDTEIRDAEGRVRARFAQSSLAGTLHSLESLRRTAHDAVPSRSEENAIDLFVLTAIDGRASLEEISRQVAAKYPARFDHWQAALTYVSRLIKRD